MGEGCIYAEPAWRSVAEPETPKTAATCVLTEPLEFLLFHMFRGTGLPFVTDDGFGG